jgi:hypothetical protein
MSVLVGNCNALMIPRVYSEGLKKRSRFLSFVCGSLFSGNGSKNSIGDNPRILA